MLELQHISYTVQDEAGTVEILNDLSLVIPDGKTVVITGPNGGGKSTLARLIMGIVQPTAGRILFNGTDITHMPINERANLGIGYAFQQPPRFKGLTVRRLLSLAHGSELPEDVCCSDLSRVGLCSKDYLNREVDASLSGGEVKRIEIATLMARDLRLSIYDEPEAGIDLWSFSMLVNSFKAMRKENDQTIVIISHQERIMQLADTIVVVAGGSIRQQGAGAEIFPQLMGSFQEDCGFRKEDRA